MGIDLELMKLAIKNRRLEMLQQGTGMTTAMCSYFLYDKEMDLSILIENVKRKIGNHVFCCWKSRIRKL